MRRTPRAAGLHVGRETRNSLELPVRGTVGEIDNAFAVTEQRLRLPNGRRAFANNVAPTLPVSVAPYVQGVLGMDNVTVDQPQGLERPSALSHRRTHRLDSVRLHPNFPTNGGRSPRART